MKHLQDLGKISYITALKTKGKSMEYNGLYKILKFLFTKDINTSRRKIIKPEREDICDIHIYGKCILTYT